ncbi:hypothetical protein AIIKEEIJ_00832 [Rhodococcus sp. YH1]|nr:hypothetical protein [Rhodococcus sp. YH1]
MSVTTSTCFSWFLLLLPWLASITTRSGRPGRVPPAHPVDATAGMGGRAGQVHTLDRRAGTTEAGQRPEHELLMDLGGAAVDRPPDEVRVGGLEVARALHAAVHDRAQHPRRVRLEFGVDAPGEFLRGGVVGDTARQMRVRPGAFRSLRGAGRICGGHLAEDEERMLRDAAGREVGRPVHETVGVGAEVDGPGRRERRRAPRNRPVERVVHLHDGRVPLEAPQVVADRGGHGVRGQERTEQCRRGHVGQYRAPYPEPLPLLGADLGRHTAADLDAGDLPAAQDPGPAAFAAPRQGRRELPGAALGHRIADVLGEHGQDVSHDSAARRVHGGVGVHGVAEQQQPRVLTAEQFLGHPAGGQRQHPHEAQCVRGAEPADQPRRAAHRWKRLEQGAQEGLTDALPLLGQADPGGPVAGVAPFEFRRGLGDVRVDHRGVLVVRPGGVPVHPRRPPQPQPV